jgi:N-acetylglutamate synthase-like GNAT family acetyltransferase
MHIREATHEDIPIILSLWKEAGLPIKEEGRDHPSQLEYQMKTAVMWILLAIIKDQPVGVILVTHDSRKGWINRLAVKPEYRRRTIATKLLARAEQTLHKQGIEVYSALIEKSNFLSRKLFERSDYCLHEDIFYYSKRIRESS